MATPAKSTSSTSAPTSAPTPFTIRSPLTVKTKGDDTWLQESNIVFFDPIKKAQESDADAANRARLWSKTTAATAEHYATTISGVVVGDISNLINALRRAMEGPPRDLTQFQRDLPARLGKITKDQYTLLDDIVLALTVVSTECVQVLGSPIDDADLSVELLRSVQGDARFATFVPACEELWRPSRTYESIQLRLLEFEQRLSPVVLERPKANALQGAQRPPGESTSKRWNTPDNGPLQYKDQFCWTCIDKDHPATCNPACDKKATNYKHCNYNDWASVYRNPKLQCNRCKVNYVCESSVSKQRKG
jgi:hypothetical protein